MLHRSEPVTPSLNKSQTENQSPEHCQWSISVKHQLLEQGLVGRGWRLD